MSSRKKKEKDFLKIINNKQKDNYEDEFGLFDKNKRISSEFFLNYYSTNDVLKLLEDCEIIKVLRERHKFKNLCLKIDINEFDQHSLIIYDESIQNEPLILLRLREVYFDAFKHFISGIKIVNVPMLLIDWITIQDPRKRFSAKRKKLPGQSYPGLGMLRQFYKLLLRIGKDLGVKAILAVPEYFHLAFIYSPIMDFYDPELQGKFLSMIKDLYFLEMKKGYRRSIAECSNLIERGKAFNYIKNEIEHWHPSEMIVPLDKKDQLYQYFNSPIYKELEDGYKESNRYRFLN